MMKERLNTKPLLLQIPLGKEDNFSGVCDLITKHAIVWQKGTDGSTYDIKEIPQELKEKVDSAHKELMEFLAMHNDEIAELYLENKPVPHELIHKTIRELVLQCKVFPVLLGASLRNIGVQPLLDAICEYLPSPADLPPVKGTHPKTGKEEIRSVSREEPFCGLIFKVRADPYGKFAYTRIYSGKIETGKQVLNTNTGKKERIAQIYRVHANKREKIDLAEVGDIVGVVGLKNVTAGDTICDVHRPIMLERPERLPTVVDATLRPATKLDSDKLPCVIEKIKLDDPSIEFKIDKETGEPILSGLGELHLDVTVRRMREEYGINISLKNPRVAFRETITKEVVVTGKFHREIGEKIHAGEVTLRLKHNPKETRKFIVEKFRHLLPQEILDAIEEGVIESLDVGPLTGYPVTHVEVILEDCKYSPDTGTPIAFKAASSEAMRKGLEQGEPTILEPIMLVECITPREFVGPVMEDLVSREGKIFEHTVSGDLNTIKAKCPLRNLFGYATQVRSLTQGRAVHMIEFDSYRELPPSEKEKLLVKIRGF